VRDPSRRCRAACLKSLRRSGPVALRAGGRQPTCNALTRWLC